MRLAFGQALAMLDSSKISAPLRHFAAFCTGLSVFLVPLPGIAQSALIRGEVFLKQNAKVEGVKTLPSGLQIKVLKQGNGRQPKSTETVVVHYRGRLVSGTEFDSSYKRGEPATFKLNQVIKGWTEGIQLLKEGGRAELYIPSDLAYGSKGSGSSIGPDEALIFEVELLSVK
jgi:FKBP-type peptidyl-prolyl cis-trans isomerase